MTDLTSAGRGRRILAVLFSLLTPGLGHCLLGAWRAGLIWIFWQIVLAAIILLLIAYALPSAEAYLLAAGAVVLLFFGLRIVSAIKAAQLGRARASPQPWRMFFATCALAIAYQAVAGVGMAAVRDAVNLQRVFSIPSMSMMPTLKPGDTLATATISPTQPERGDIIFFPFPKDRRVTYVKRVIGLAGDRIAMRDGHVILNGQALPQVSQGEVSEPDDIGITRLVLAFKETLPGGRDYTIYRSAPLGSLDTMAEVTVPTGAVFVLGDNRDNSQDSRMVGQFGEVRASSIVGRGGIIFFSPDPSRIFNRLR